MWRNICKEQWSWSPYKNKHKPNGKYKCETCGKTFALRWRLKKHQESHASLKARKCHYFNNEKVCPFEEIGCMFDHTLSKMCSYGQGCSHKLCSYQHGAYNSTNDKNNELTDKVDKVSKEKFVELTSDEQYDDKDEVNGDKSDKENTDDNLEFDDSEILEDEETEIIYQKFLENHKKRETEQKKKLN